jgi:vancomycin resistance protein YoaR
VTYAGAGKPITWTVTAEEVGATFDYTQLLDQAMAVGRREGFFGSIGARGAAWFGRKTLPAVAQADPALLKATLGKITKDVDIEPTDASLTIKSAKITAKPASDGLSIRRDKLESDLLSTFTKDYHTIAATAEVTKPRISDQGAADAKVVVQKMVSAPAAITFQKKTWTVSPKEISNLISFRAVAATGTAVAQPGWILEPFVSAAEASKTIVPKLGASLGTPPRDARFKTQKGSVTIVASQNGIGPDVSAMSESLTRVLKSDSASRTVELLTITAAPKFTTQQAKAMGITERISTFTTTYDGGNATRTNNIHTLGAALDGKLVPPGGTFSFNGYVGERTASKGYQEANAIVNGKLVPQLGGGICQVGTTLFNTVFFSGFPVIERSNHSFYISHYPTGRDATVSWGGPDLKWKNDSANWVLVSVSYTSDSITMSLYGTSPGYKVTYTTGPLTTGQKFPIEEVKDPTLKTGLKVVQDPGVDGKRVVVTRVVKKGSTVVRTDTFTSNYKPKTEVVRVGTKAAASKTATTTPAPKKP